MADGAFVSADIGKISKFISDSEDAIKEFNAIKDEFESINNTLLEKWEGQGADAYKKETSHILENIGGLKDVLDSINNGAVTCIRDEYNNLDQQLDEFNRNPSAES